MANRDAPKKSDEKEIRARIQPVIKLLDAPYDLDEFMSVVTEFSAILELYRPLSKPPESDVIAKIEHIVNEIITGEISVTSSIASARPDKKRETLKPHYRSHPHYCLYWHRCADKGLQLQYRALLACFLPVQTRLQSAKVCNPHPFEDIAYLVGLYLRQLSKPSDIELKILRELLPKALPPADLRIRLEEIYSRFQLEFKVTGDLKAIGYLHRALLWFESGVWEQGLKESRKSHAHRESPRHGGSPLNDAKEIVYATGHSQEVGGPLIGRTFYADDAESSEVHQEDSDADPVGEGAKTCESVEIPGQSATAYNSIDRIALTRRRARYAAQAIEMANQNLPITRATLTGFELKALLRTLSDTSLIEWSAFSQRDRAQIAAWGACRFFTGRAPEAMSKMHVQADGRTNNPSCMMLDADRKNIWLPCESPRHRAPDDLGQVLVPAPGFNLNVANTLAPYLRRVSSRTHRLFARNFEEDFGQLLQKINSLHGTSLTLTRVGNCIAGLIAQMAPNDEVMAVYFSGRPPNQHNPSVYSSVPTVRIASLFDQACKRIYELAEFSQVMTETSVFPNLLLDEEEVVGSMHVPKLETLRLTIADILAKLEKSKNIPGTPVHELHNTYTAYVLLFALATTAIRAVRKPIPAWFDIDRATGCCFVSEKDNDTYGNGRVVWLHPALLKQFDEYARHTTRLRQYLALVNLHALDKLDARNSVPLLSSVDSPNRSADESRLQGRAPVLFMLSDYAGHPTDILPDQVVDLLGASWQLRLVSLRHFVRTQLLQAGCSGTLINALLGHGDRGQSPWGDYSTLPPEVWRKQLAEHLAPILNRLGFEIVASPLLKS